MIHTIETHPAIFAIGSYWLFSAIVSGMPEPSASSGSGYRGLHQSLHILAGNLTAAVTAKYPITVPSGSAVEHKEMTTVVTSQS